MAPSRTVTPVRLAVVAAAALLLWSRGPSLPNVLAAIFLVTFFCWFAGPRRPQRAPAVEIEHKNREQPLPR